MGGPANLINFIIKYRGNCQGKTVPFREDRACEVGLKNVLYKVEMRIVLDAPLPRIVPPLKLKIEHGREIGSSDLTGLNKRITTALHDQIKIRPEIQLVPPGTLPKETRKTPVFEKKYENA